MVSGGPVGAGGVGNAAADAEAAATAAAAALSSLPPWVLGVDLLHAAQTSDSDKSPMSRTIGFMMGPFVR
jgi:hypothetical protein